MYILYGGRFTRALIVEMVLAEGGIPYELREIDILKEENRSPEFLEVNPAGWVPALVTPDGQSLYETPAISLYLAERHKLDDLVPEVGAPERGLFLSGLFYLTNELEPALKRFFYPHRYGVRPEDTSEIRKQSQAMALDRLDVIEGRLRDEGPFHLGNRYSLIDLVMAYWAEYLVQGQTPERYPAVTQCLSLVRSRPKICTKFDQLRAWREDYYARMEIRAASEP